MSDERSPTNDQRMMKLAFSLVVRDDPAGSGDSVARRLYDAIRAPGSSATEPSLTEAGLEVGLESVENRFLLSPREWTQFLDDVANPARVRMYFDVGNVVYMRVGHPQQWIRQLGRKYITRIHFKDAAFGGPQCYLLE